MTDLPTTAANMTFTTLVSDLQVYLERGEPVTDPTVFAQLPRLINLAERAIMNDLRLLGSLEPIKADGLDGLRVSVPVVTKPDRWRQTVSMRFTGPAQAILGSGNILIGPNAAFSKFLFPRSYEYCRAFWPVEQSVGTPRFYADYDLTHWLIAPTPNASYTLEMMLYMQPIYLDAVNQTNFFTNYTPNLLLYQTLLEASPFLKNDPRMATWQAMADRQKQVLSGLDLQRVLDRGEVRQTA